MKAFLVKCNFHGTIHYEVEAESEKEAIRKARIMFMNDDAKNVHFHVEDTDNDYTVV